jgi:SAM-dependent methyltransferase
MRAIVHLLSRALFGRSLSLPEFPVDKQLTGVGLSDWEVYADQLAAKLDYRNTYLDRDPKLDITRIDPSLERSLDFLISTDVFEHVQPPVSVAFENACRLLKPGGCLIFTVPYTNEPGTRTVEHFPDLYDFELQTAPGQPARLRNRTRDGQEQVFDDLVFHGGGGLTLEMRVFTEESLLQELARAGFEDVRICREQDLEHGIYWSCDWSLPLVARSRRSAGPG